MEERRKNNRIKLTSSLFIKRLNRDTQEKVEIEILGCVQVRCWIFMLQAVGDRSRL